MRTNLHVFSVSNKYRKFTTITNQYAVKIIKGDRMVESVGLHISRHPLLKGFGSLGNIGGGYASFRKYMQGNDLEDMRRDWQCVGNDISKSISQINK